MLKKVRQLDNGWFSAYPMLCYFTLELRKTSEKLGVLWDVVIQ